MKTSNVKLPENTAFRIKIDSGFLLLFALIFFFDEDGLLAALLPAVFMHEIGHLLVMLFFGARPLRLNAAISGFAIDYSGAISEKQELSTALAGPAAGLLFALLCARLGRSFKSDYLLMCAGLGLVLNIFNLLPAVPLDGGRALDFALSSLFGEAKAASLLHAVSLITAFIVTIFGLYLTARGLGFALFLAGIWLFIAQTNKSCK